MERSHPYRLLRIGREILSARHPRRSQTARSGSLPFLRCWNHRQSVFAKTNNQAPKLGRPPAAAEHAMIPLAVHGESGQGGVVTDNIRESVRLPADVLVVGVRKSL